LLAFDPPPIAGNGCYRLDVSLQLNINICPQ